MTQEEKWNESLSLLLAGEYDIGFPDHEFVRTGSQSSRCEYQPTESFNRPVWNGETSSTTLLVNADFGMGDTIQFWRFVPLARSRVARLILRCDEDFKTLFREVDVVGKEDPLPEFDHIIHMMCLPKVLGADISGASYLTPNYDSDLDWWAFEIAMRATRFTKIGVCWRGNPYNDRDHLRSLPQRADEWFLMGFGSGMRFFSLDKTHPPPSQWYMDCRQYMKDWNETARLVKMLDLVITVDTAVAHLAGALGVPVWNLIPTEHPDWRWGLTSERTLWYDSMRLYRNTNGWQDLMERVRDDVVTMP